jgi:hypothetical protein
MIPNVIVVNGESIEYDYFYRRRLGQTMPDKDWQERTKGILKAELKRMNVGYRDLAEKLTAMGVPETEANIKNKISRGGFTAVFLLQCLEAAGVQNLRLD